VRDVTARLRRGYSLGSVATGAFGTVPGLLLLPYLTDTLGIAAVPAGVIVFAPKAWDVVLNPIVGRASDRYATRRLTRRPFMLIGGIALAVAFALLFAGPVEPQAVAASWVVIVFVACATAYAFFQVPFVAMPAELTDDYAERTRIMTWRVAVLSLAILVSGASAPAIRDAVGGKSGYRAMGLAIGALLALGTLGSYLGTRRAPATRVRSVSGTLRDQLRITASARDFRALLATYVLQALASGAMLAGVDYLARDVLGNKSVSSVLFDCFVAPALLVAPAWARFARRHGKTTGYRAATLVMLAGALALISARVAPSYVVFAATAIAGVGYAGTQVFPLAMLPDVAALDALRSGRNRIGVFTGVWTAGETLGLAIGPGLYALTLAAGGYVSSTGGYHPVQPGSALTAITLGFSLLPAVLVAASLLPLRRYLLSADEVRSAQRVTAPRTGSREEDLDGT
jgi:Na+/melibiose symporter-like transporter